MPLELVRQSDVGLLRIIGSDRITLVQLVPPSLIQSGVMVAGDGGANLIKVRKRKHGVGGSVSSSRGPEDPNTRRVHVGILRGHLLDHGNVIFERSSEIVVRKFVEGA